MPYDDNSDADDEYERSVIASPGLPPGAHSPDHTPRTYKHPLNGESSPTSGITDWSPEQCSDFVTNLGLEQYATAMIDQEIDGQALIAMHHDEFKDLGIRSVGHRLTILKAVYDIKLQHNVQIDSDHYVPLSAEVNAPDAHATQDDVARIIRQIQLRDERLEAAESELRALKDDFQRVLDENRSLREEVIPVIRKPLSTPDSQYNDPTSPHYSTVPMEPKSALGLGRKLSTKKSHASTLRWPSPVLPDPDVVEPSPAALAAAASLHSSFRSQHGIPPSPSPSQEPSPTSPNYAYNSSDQGPRSASRLDSRSGSTDPITDRNRKTLTQSNLTPTEGEVGPSKQQQDSTNEFMKSFRVGMDERCINVLPIALRKYRIKDDWRQYSLYIVHGDQERCLGLEEKPLLLFKQLSQAGRKPMFMLRRHATPSVGFDRPLTMDVTSPGLAPSNGMAPPGARSSAMSSSVNLPGGVL